MVSLIAILKAKSGKEHVLMEEVTKLTQETRQESGCISYIPHVLVEDPTTITIYEKYADQAAFDYHAQSPHFQALFSEKAKDLLDGPLKVEMLKEF